MIKKIITASFIMTGLFGILTFSLINHSNPRPAAIPAFFTNYTVDDNGLPSDNAGSVAFDSNNDVGYASGGPQTANPGYLSIGTKNADNDYNFTNYNNTNGIVGGVGTGVAFDARNDVGYSSTNGGLSIGFNNNGVYSFLYYNALSDPDLGNNIGTSVAFNHDDDVAYASLGGGLSIGFRNFDTYTFRNFSTQQTGGSTFGRGVAFADNGDIGFVSSLDIDSTSGGLSIGTSNGNGDYTFAFYNVASKPGLQNNDGESVAFDNEGNVAYASKGGGLSIGIKSGNTYNFTNYNTNMDGITSNAGTDVAFASNRDVAYASTGGGISIGTPGADNSYTFTNYSLAGGIGDITNDDGTGVAFNSNNDAAYVSQGGGLALENVLATSFDPDNVKIALRNDSNFNITTFQIGFNFALSTIVPGTTPDSYIRVALTTASSSTPIGAYYLTRDGSGQSDFISGAEVAAFASGTNNNYTTTTTLTNSGAGFVSGVPIIFTISAGNAENNLTEVATYQVTIVTLTPVGPSEPIIPATPINPAIPPPTPVIETNSNFAIDLGAGLGSVILILSIGPTAVVFLIYRKHRNRN